MKPLKCIKFRRWLKDTITTGFRDGITNLSKKELKQSETQRSNKKVLLILIKFSYCLY